MYGENISTVNLFEQPKEEKRITESPNVSFSLDFWAWLRIDAIIFYPSTSRLSSHADDSIPIKFHLPTSTVKNANESTINNIIKMKMEKRVFISDKFQEGK